MKMLSKSFLLSLLGCAATPFGGYSAHEMTRMEQLDRVVILDGQVQYSMPLRVRIDPRSANGYWLPLNAHEAVAELRAMLPANVVESDLGSMASECRLDNYDQLDDFRNRCSVKLCGRLPADSQDPTCSYFTRLVGWVEKAWLGGACASVDWVPDAPLAINLAQRGLYSCHDMSSAVVDLLLTSLAGMPVTPERMIELYIQRGQD